MQRRTFVTLMAAPAFAAAKVRVGAHPWVYAAKQPDRDPTPILGRIFEEMGRAGLDGIELMHPVLTKDDAVVAQVAELSRRHRLPVIGSSWGAPMWQASQREVILKEAAVLLKRLQRLGGRTLGVSVGDAGRTKTPAEFDAQAETLRAAIRMAADHGVILNLHNHVYEVANGEFDLRNTLARVPEAKLGPDIGWLVRARVDPLDFIERHKSRLVFAHLRDEKADGSWPEAMGEGAIDYAAIGKKLHAIGFAGDLVIELAHPPDFRPTRSYGESIRLSREFVRRTMRY